MRVKVMMAAAALLAGSALGCGEARPMTAGGKPVSHWVGAIHDRDVKVRRQAAAKLGNVGPADPAALPALAGALKDPDAAVRREVIVALLKCGPAAREAAPALDELRRHDRDPRVRAFAARALEKLGGRPEGGR